MPPVIVTADNIPDVLAQLAERQDEQSAAIELLAEQLADQSIRTDEALHTQAAALRATVAQQARTISEIAKAAKQNGNGNGSNSDRSGNNPGNNPGNNGDNGNPGRNRGGIAGAGVGGEANLGPIEASAEIGGRIGNGQGQKPVVAAAAKPEEPKAPERKRAHRWI